MVALFLAMMLAVVACESGGTDDVEADSDEANESDNADEAADNGTDDEQPPDSDFESSVAIGTHSVGTSFHTVGSALSSLISSHTSLEASVFPAGGPSVYIPDIHAGDLAFGYPSVIDAGWGYRGGPGFDEASPSIRTVASGATLRGSGITVRQDSGIETIEELEGERVGSDYGGAAVSEAFVELGLASVGLDWEDTQQVPIAETAAGIDSLRAGQVDAISGLSPVAPDIVDAHAAVPLKVLPVANLTPEDIENGVPEDVQSVIDEIAPGATLATEAAGTGILDEDTVLIEHPTHLISSTNVPDETVYEVLEAIWEHHEELHDSHPLGEWYPEDMLSDVNQAPYHDAAVQFYEDQGVWTDEHQERQDELLEQAEG